MDRNRFNREVRPYLTQVPIGHQGVAFDRLELDDWADDHIRRNGRPGRLRGERLWDEREYRASSNVVTPGTSTSRFVAGEFEKAVEQVNSRKQSST